MAIIVEDGSDVANANSWVSRAEAIAFAAARGVTLADSTATDILIIKAMDYLESMRPQYVGTRTYDDQTLSFPRTGLTIDGLAFADDEIPPQLKSAEMLLVIYGSRGIDFLPSVSDKFVVEEQVGPLRTKYSESINTGTSPIMPMIDAYLEQLLTFGGAQLQLVRV